MYWSKMSILGTGCSKNRTRFMQHCIGGYLWAWFIIFSQQTLNFLEFFSIFGNSSWKEKKKKKDYSRHVLIMSLLLFQILHVLRTWLPLRDLKSVSGFTDTGYLLLGIWEIHGRCLTRNPRNGILGVASKWLKTALVDFPGDRKTLSIGLVDSKPHSFFLSVVDFLTALEWVYGRMEFFGIRLSSS